MTETPIVIDLDEPDDCNWFAMCANTALQAVEHPLFGYVTCCERCKIIALGARA